MKFRWVLVLILAVALVAAACGGDDDDDDATGSDTATEADDGVGTSAPTATPTEDGDGGAPANDAGADSDAPTDDDDADAPADDADADADDDAVTEASDEQDGQAATRLPADVVDPGDAGAGVILPVAAAPLPEGWTETEFIFGGEATSYEAVGETGTDGMWEVAEAEVAHYRTRMIVRRPPAEDFSGVVLVEWFNVTAGADTSPDLTFLTDEIEREGHVWVGVSAQEVSVNGRDGDFVGGGLIDTSGLVARDPERYGDLEHPGDAYAFDIFTQAGAALKAQDGSDLLAGLTPAEIVAVGESQSAGFLTTYVNAVHPLARFYDGFLVHSRGAGAPEPSAERVEREEGVRVRADLEEPVFLYVTETDLTVLGYADARQDDSATVHTWEVAGTAHADAHTLAVATGSPRDASLGSIIGCETPINDGPQHETVQAAVNHLVAWVADGVPPPPAQRLEVDDEGAIVRDELGIAVGGIRTPPVDVPNRVLSGDPGVSEGACFLFGQTLPLAPDVLAGLYDSEAVYLEALQASADEAVASGWMLTADADALVADETARVATLGLG